MATANLGYQSFYQAQLTAAISDTDLTIPLDVVPTPSEGFLVLESTSATKREIIYYTSKTSNSVVCPSGGRGYDGTTAQSHTQNSAVIMAPVAAMFSSMRDLFETTPQGWTPVTQTVSSVSYSGNRSYSLTMSADVSATLSPGMRVRTTRTVSAPTQCTSLNGTTQYYSKTTPTGITFTTTFTTSAWVKLNSYGATSGIIARRNAAIEGWSMFINTSGQVILGGYRIASNNKTLTSYQSIPLNKWVHVAATLDMAAGDTTAQKIWIDGVEVPRQYTLTGTATALVQGTTALVVGANQSDGANPFPGKIAQAAVFSSQLSDATVKSYYSQGLTGTETNLVSAYSFNGNANDLNTTNANNLTAQGSAVATNADSPFSTNSFDTETGTEDYGIVQSVATTTVVVQVPVGCTIPTSGGVSAMSYSTQQAPYGFTVDKNKWTITNLYSGDRSTSSPVQNTWYNPNTQITVPIGSFNLYANCQTYSDRSVAGSTDYVGTLSNVNNNSELEYFTRTVRADNSTLSQGLINITRNLTLSAATVYYYNHRTRTTSIVTLSTQALILELLPSGI